LFRFILFVVVVSKLTLSARVLSRFTPVVVAVLEFFMLGRRTSTAVALSLGMCCCGFIIAGIGDLVFNLAAYSLALFSCLSQALYLITVDRTGRELGMQSHELLYYNSLLSLLVLLPMVLWTGELKSALFEFEGWTSPLFLFCLVMMLLLGMSLNYCQFLCTQGKQPL
jgi:drug/metabolite transporter (DMT)-like permease